MWRMILLAGASMAALMPVTAAQAAVLDVGLQEGTYTGNSRGYWFTAPVDFYITGLFVPTDASSANQNVAVVKLGAVPPDYPSTTNDFTTLALFRDDSTTGFISTSIQFLTGDLVGILGSRSNVSSYGSAAYASSIGSNGITLYRLGFQDELASTGPQHLFTENWRISRVEFSYELGLAPGGVPEPASWAMLIAGFGLTGAAMRRRRVVAAIA